MGFDECPQLFAINPDQMRIFGGHRAHAVGIGWHQCRPTEGLTCTECFQIHIEIPRPVKAKSEFNLSVDYQVERIGIFALVKEPLTAADGHFLGDQRELLKKSGLHTGKKRKAVQHFDGYHCYLLSSDRSISHPCAHASLE